MIVIVIPAFNEAVPLAQLLPALPQHIDGRVVRTVVVDDGARSATGGRGRQGGHGIAGMRERVEALGGTLEAGPATGARRTTRCASRS